MPIAPVSTVNWNRSPELSSAVSAGQPLEFREMGNSTPALSSRIQEQKLAFFYVDIEDISS